jgi:phosphoribosyl 1,2-cyclic phosphodiesterase
MRFASLASGSKGNCHAIDDGERTLLIDAGISLKQIKTRLELLGWRADQVRGVAITHEHIDHVRAVPVIWRRTDWNILATPATVEAMDVSHGIEVPKSRWVPLKAGRTDEWEDWRLHPFSVSHDAMDPVAYRVEAAGKRLAVITDIGLATALTVEHASSLDLLVLESNHDVGMLREGSYPPDLQSRILSRDGHLSNDSCAELLEKVISPALRNVVLVHLSEENNDPALAKLTSTQILKKAGSRAKLRVARQDKPIELEV